MTIDFVPTLSTSDREVVAVFICLFCGYTITWFDRTSLPNTICGPHRNEYGEGFMSVMTKIYPKTIEERK